MNYELKMRKIVLLHICCGICASSVIERLRGDGFEVVGLFYNPNIYPQQEYQRRLNVVSSLSQLLDLRVIEGEYDYDRWLDLTKGLENEPEGGARCSVCFQMRLETTWEKSCELQISYFATTLSVSPHKDALVINKTGNNINSEAFLEYDFKKQDGFKRAMEFSKQHLLYRQNYCGCVYIMRRTQVTEGLHSSSL